MLVDFMILGAQRCGTTSLYDILNSHDDLVGSRPKEPHFFSLSRDWKNELGAYEESFSHAEGKSYFEASSSYTFSPNYDVCVWKRIYEYNPNMKFIYLVRNPIERIISSYILYFEQGYTKLSLDESVIKDRIYIDASRYYSQIIPYIQYFGRENVLIVEFEQFVRERSVEIQKIADFLNVDFKGFFNFEETHANKSMRQNRWHYKYHYPTLLHRILRKTFPYGWEYLIKRSSRSMKEKPTMSAEVEEIVKNLLFADIEKLGDLTGSSFRSWIE